MSISSLDKLNNKLRSNLVGEENRGAASSNESKHEYQVPQKRFIEEVTKEVLIVARDGCYTYEQKGENQVIISKLNDVREILDTGLHSLSPT